MTNPLVNRIKSFIWRAVMMAIAAGLAWIAQNIGLLELDPIYTTVLGLVLGEISKYLNTSK
jgi:hypothetical protein